MSKSYRNTKIKLVGNEVDLKIVEAKKKKKSFLLSKKKKTLANLDKFLKRQQEDKIIIIQTLQELTVGAQVTNWLTTLALVRFLEDINEKVKRKRKKQFNFSFLKRRAMLLSMVFKEQLSLPRDFANKRIKMNESLLYREIEKGEETREWAEVYKNDILVTKRYPNFKFYLLGLWDSEPSYLLPRSILT